jgi:hypothetical protein
MVGAAVRQCGDFSGSRLHAGAHEEINPKCRRTDALTQEANVERLYGPEQLKRMTAWAFQAARERTKSP